MPEIVESTSPGKRKINATNGVEDKRAVPVYKSAIKEWSAVEGRSMLKTIPMTLKGHHGCKLVFWVNNKVSIHNNKAEEFQMAPGTQISGFGIGKWKLEGKDPDIDPSTMIMFGLAGDDTKIIFNSHLTTVGEVVKNKRKNEPMCKVCYHAMQDGAAGSPPGSFTLTTEHKVFFAPEPTAVSSEVGQTSAASLLPPSAWKTPFSDVLWHCKWNANGLGPIRPFVGALEQISIPPGRVLDFCGESDFMAGEA